MYKYYYAYRWKAVGVVTCLVSFYVVIAVLMPGIDDIIDTYDQVQQKEKKIELVDNWETKLKSLKSKERRLEGFFGKLFISVSNSDEMSAIVSLVYTEGDEAGINVQQIKPLESFEESSFTKIPIKITALGEFHSFVKFINGMEQTNRLIKVKSVNFLNIENKRPKLLAEITLRIVVMRRESLNRSEDE